MSNQSDPFTVSQGDQESRISTNTKIINKVNQMQQKIATQQQQPAKVTQIKIHDSVQL